MRPLAPYPILALLKSTESPGRSEGVGEGSLPLPQLDSLVENGEVELPAQAADDTVIGHPHGKVVIFILGEGNGVCTLAAVVLLQEEFEGDVELALAVLHEGQIFQV